VWERRGLSEAVSAVGLALIIFAVFEFSDSTSFSVGEWGGAFSCSGAPVGGAYD